MKKTSFDCIQQQVEKVGYLLLSTEYKAQSEPLLVRCPNGHQYATSWKVFRRGFGRCKICRPKRESHRRLTLKSIRVEIKKQRYILLSTIYRDSQQKLKMECPEAHICHISWNNFQQGHRCPYCSKNKSSQIKYEKLVQLFRRERGKVLTQYYARSTVKMLFECFEGHRYKATPTSIQQGYRCPECKAMKSEKNLGEILRQIFPGQVKSQDNLGFLGRQRVDYSVRDLNLAFEYDGEQHFRSVCFGGMSEEKAEKQFKIQQHRDQKKNKLCEKNKIHLIRVKYDEDLTKDYIERKIKQQGILLPKDNSNEN